MFVQKRCLFDTYVLQKKKLRRKFRDSLTLWWVHWRMRLFYMSGERLLWVPTIARVQCCTYKYLKSIYLCSIVAIRALIMFARSLPCEGKSPFQSQPKDFTAQSISSRCITRKSPLSVFLRGSNDYDVNICINMCNICLQSYLYRIDLKLIPRSYGR